MKINARTIADESLSVPFDPLLAVRLHSSTQLKRRAVGARGVALMNGTREFFEQYTHIDSLPLERYAGSDWPDILWDDMRAFHEPLTVAEKIPHSVFRTIRRLRGESVVLTRGLLDEGRRLAEEAGDGVPVSDAVKAHWAHDSSSPLFVGQVLERFRQHKLLPNFAFRIERDATLAAVTEGIVETIALVRARLGLPEPEGINGNA